MVEAQAVIILCPLVNGILRRINSLITSEISFARGFRRQLSNLQGMMGTVQGVLLAAEERQGEIDGAVREWLEGLRDILYVVDDLLDDISTENLRSQGKNLHVRNQVSKSFSIFIRMMSKSKLADRFRDVNKRLAYLTNEIGRFNFLANQNQAVEDADKVKEHVFPSIYWSRVVGRDDERKDIISFLTENHSKKAVVTISGDRGVGKTKLAKLVIDDEKVRRHFDHPIYYNKFDLNAISKDLRQQLQGELVGKKPLVVLDDVNCLTQAQCDELRDLLKVGVAGVLIATTDQCIANMVGESFTSCDEKGNEDEVLRKPTQSHDEGIRRRKWKEQIMEFLLDNCDEKLSIRYKEQIMGHGNSLLKSICEDKRVESRFEYSKRVSVSCEEFNLKKIVECILEDVDSDKTLEWLQLKLRKQLQQKKFLLVLEDMSDMNPYQRDKLCGLLMNDRVGNKVLITTRNKQVALVPDQTNQLEPLYRDKRMHLEPLFVNHVYEKGNSILMDIMNLHFDSLPSSIKICFMYSLCFSVHPPSREKLTQQWIAQGFIDEPSGDNKRLEDVASKYFGELVSRSFFYNLVQDDFMAETRFEVHDIVRDLAHLVSKGECSVTSSDEIENIPFSVHHVAFLDGSKEEFPSSLKRFEKLRTFKCENFGSLSTTTLNVPPFFRSLRVLDLSCSVFHELTSRIDELKHLRYLDLSGNTYLERLPSSLFKLYSLETLRVDGCSIEELPREIMKLQNLRNLYACTEQGSISEGGICGLTSLRILHLDPIYNLKKLPKEMENLTALETLVLKFCSTLELLESDMEGLTSLRSLTITRLRKQSIIPRGLLKAASLSSLGLFYCVGLTLLPEWLEELQCLRRLCVEFCPNLTASPKGICLPSGLQYLSIRGCPELIRRCEGEDRPKISHIGEIRLEGKIVLSESSSSSSVVGISYKDTRPSVFPSSSTDDTPMEIATVDPDDPYFISGPNEEDEVRIESIPDLNSSTLPSSSKGEGMESQITAKTRFFDPELELTPARLRLIYDNIDEKETKFCLLLCCLFPKEREIPIEGIVRYAMGIGLFGDATTTSEVRVRVNAAIEELTRSSLLVKDTSSNSLTMNRLVREFATSVASGDEHKFFIVGEPQSDDIRCRVDHFITQVRFISNRNGKDISWRLHEFTDCPSLVLLSWLGDKSSRGIPDYHFRAMIMLRVLDLSDSSSSWSFTGRSLAFKLPESFKYLESLRSLLLDFCTLEGEDLSIIGYLSKLEILSFRGSNLTELPVEIGQLNRLRLLDLGDCRKLESIPANVISRLSNLEELYMKGGFKNWEVIAVARDNAGKRNASLWEIQSLSSLTVFSADVGGVNCLPSDFTFSGKFDLKIGDVRFLSSQDADIRQRGWVNELSLRGDDHRHILFGSSLLSKVGQLILEDVNMTAILNDKYDEGAFNAIKSLCLNGCDDLEYLSGLTNAFANLEEIFLKNLVDMKGFGKGVPTPGSFQNLKILEIWRCRQWSGVIPSNWIRILPKLEQLHVVQCSEVRQIIDVVEIANEPKMTPPVASIKILRLESLEGLVTLCQRPQKIISFSNLTQLHIFNCPNLTSIFSPYMSQTLFHLQALNITWCNNLRVIFEEPEEGAALRDEIQPILFPELKTVSVIHCQQLESLFPVSIASGLMILKELNISYCSNLEELVSCRDSIGTEREANSKKILLPRLTKLKLRNSYRLKRFCPTGYSLRMPSLEKLKLDECAKLVKLTSDTAASYGLMEIPASARIVHTEAKTRFFDPELELTPARLRLIYDNIDEKETKFCLLLCCLFPKERDIPIEGIVRYAMGIGLFGDATTTSEVRVRVNAAIEELTRSSLLVKDTWSNALTMDRLVRKFATSVASGDEHKFFIVDWPQSVDIRWREDHFITQVRFISNRKGKNISWRLPEYKDCPRLELLSWLGNKSSRGIPDYHFRAMIKLRVLDLSGSSSSWSRYGRSLAFKLPESFKYLESLRSLLLDLCTLEGDNLSIIGDLSKLEILSFRGSNLTELPVEIGRLNRLRLLDLGDCWKLESIPANVISRLSNLEELYMKGGFKNWEVIAVARDNAGKRNASLWEIQSLSSLTVFSADVGGVNCLPSDFTFSGKFDLKIGDVRLPFRGTYITQPWWVNKLALRGDNHRHILFASSLLSKVGQLILEDVNMTAILNDKYDEGAFNAIKSLCLNGCDDLEYLSGLTNAFANLEEIFLKNLVDMKGFGKGVPTPGSFQNLKILKIWRCRQWSGVIPSNWIRILPKLEQLHVVQCSEVRQIIDVVEIANEPKMTPPVASIKILLLQSLEGLVTLCQRPQKIISFSNLTQLHIFNCPNLTSIFSPYMSQTLFHLQALNIIWCNNLRVIFEEPEEGAALRDEIQPILFPELKTVSVIHCQQLESLFPVSIASGLMKLKELNILCCPKLKEKPTQRKFYCLG